MTETDAQRVSSREPTPIGRADDGATGPHGQEAQYDGRIPPLPRLYVPRPQLWACLDRAADGAMTLLVAPVGAGKTLGVAGWLRNGPTERARSALWMQGSRRAAPGRLEKVLDDLAASAAADRPILVIDDAHTLPAASLRLLDRRLSNAPDTFRALLLSRWDLPFNRLVPELRGYLTVLRGDLLRMDEKDGTALAASVAATTDPEVIEPLVDRAQGWCAPLVLAARLAGSSPDPVATARRYGGRTPDGTDRASVADRVASEAFAALSPRQRHVLLCAVGESVVSAEAAVHLSRDPRAADVLDDLESLGLLVTRVPTTAASDSGPGSVCYRIHPLLREVVRRRLTAGGVDVAQARATVTRAARLDFAHGQSQEAFARFVSVHAPHSAVRVLARHGPRLVLGPMGEIGVDDFLRAEPAIIEANPDTWFVMALDRWLADDLDVARYWMDRLLRCQFPAGRTDSQMHADRDLQVACVKLWRARLGLEPVLAALRHGVRVADAARAQPPITETGAASLAVLLSELGIVQNWRGELADAEEKLSAAIAISRSHGLVVLTASTMSHLAFTHYMRGNEQACVAIATEVLDQLGSTPADALGFTAFRANLAVALGELFDPSRPAPSLSSPAPGAGPGADVRTVDLTTRFWLRIRDARCALLAGAFTLAEQILTGPDQPAQLHEAQLPDHLRVVELVDLALLAALSSNQSALRAVEEELVALDACGEACMVAGLRTELLADRRGARAAFGAATAGARFDQPPTRCVALACLAQVLDADGRDDEAAQALAEALASTDARRNGMPFLGWSRQGTPMRTLLGRLDAGPPNAWRHGLVLSRAGKADITAAYAPRIPTPRERETSREGVVIPELSPREREVLLELARGSTYADIAAELFVSENTVKTHVSSLYGKLGASRRSEALAAARSAGLL